MIKLYNSNKTCWNYPAAKLMGSEDFRASGQVRDLKRGKGEDDSYLIDLIFMKVLIVTLISNLLKEYDC